MRNRVPTLAVVLLAASLAAGATTIRLSAAAADPLVADAAMRSDVDGVRTLLKGGADVSAAQSDGMTALHWAALNGDVKTMDVLLVAGAAREALTRIGAYTPLHLASQRGHGATVARLLEAGAKVGPLTTTGVQPLHLAAQAGNAEAVKALLDRGAAIDAVDTTHGRTPLVFAVSKDRREVVSLLAARGANLKATTAVIDYKERAAADTKSRQARDRIVSATTGRAVDSSFDPDPPPPGTAPSNVQSARAGQPPAEQAQVARAANVGGGGPGDPNEGRRGGGGTRPPSDIEQIGKQGGFTALHYAARDGFASTALALIDAGLDVNVPTAGDRTTPDDRGAHQRAVRPGAHAARARRRPEPAPTKTA